MAIPLRRLGVWGAPLVLALGASSCAMFRVRPPVYEELTLDEGLVVQDRVVPRKGKRAALGDLVTVHYRMRLADGTLVDSSYDRGRPVAIRLGDGELPRGVELGILGMRRFGERSLRVPPELAYGAEGLPPLIPPDALLIFDLELVELEAAP